jgi:hypothetical protein
LKDAGPYLAEVFFKPTVLKIGRWPLSIFWVSLFLLGLGLEYPYRVAGTNKHEPPSNPQRGGQTD